MQFRNKEILNLFLVRNIDKGDFISFPKLLAKYKVQDS